MRPAAAPGARYTGFGAAGKWEDLNCVAHFRFDVNGYLAGAGSRYKTVDAIVADGLYHPLINDSIASRMAVSEPPQGYPTADLRAEVRPACQNDPGVRAAGPCAC